MFQKENLIQFHLLALPKSVSLLLGVASSINNKKKKKKK